MQLGRTLCVDVYRMLHILWSLKYSK